MSNDFYEIEPHADLFQRGYDAYAQSPLIFLNSEQNKATDSVTEASVPSNKIVSGEIVSRLTLVDGYYQSPDYVTGVSGWRISSDSVEFGDGYFRGDITGANGTFSGILNAEAGVIGGFVITPTALYGSTIKTALTVGSVGTNGVIMDRSGLRGYSASLGQVFNVPTDGNPPTFSAGVIQQSNMYSTNIAGGTIVGAIITGGLLRTAGDGRRVEINSAGIQAINGNIGITYGDSAYKYGDNTRLYGSGVLVYINNNDLKVPFYVNQEQTVGDMHLYNRSAWPTGKAELGDLTVIENKLSICVSAGTPGSWAAVGAQTALVVGSASPSASKSSSPSTSPSKSPSVSPPNSYSPSISSSASPSISSSISPSVSISKSPSASPSKSLSASPSTSPSTSISPSISPSVSVSISPSKSVSISPSKSPSSSSSVSPSVSA